MKKLFLFLIFIYATYGCHSRTVEFSGESGRFIIIKENGVSRGYNIDKMEKLISELGDSLVSRDSILHIWAITGPIWGISPGTTVTFNKDSSTTISACN